jgi:6-phosphogluconolactonase
MSTPHVVETNRFVEDALEIIVHSAAQAIRERGEFRLSLCGGSTPKAIYSQFPTSGIDWSKTFITFGDERCVPPEDSQSNFRMATEAFLSKIEIPAENVLRMKGELPPDDAAAHYEDALLAHAKRVGESRFRHDLILLGMGGDGHTASLFPETKALDETKRNVVANYVDKMASWRISFTYPLINAGRHVCFLVNDPSKRQVLDAVLAGDAAYPSAKILPTEGELSWLVGK